MNQKAYDKNVKNLFDALDIVEEGPSGTKASGIKSSGVILSIYEVTRFFPGSRNRLFVGNIAFQNKP